MSTLKRPLFVKSDIDAAFGVFFDGFTKVIAGVAIMIGSIGLSSKVVFGTILPGLGFGVLLLHVFTWWLGNKTSKKTNNTSIVAIPAGITAGRFFIWLFAIMLPTYISTKDATLALGVGLAANIISSLLTIVLSFFEKAIVNSIPSAALFGTLAGGGVTWLILASLKDMFVTPLIALVCFFVLLVLYTSNIKTKLSPVLISILVGVILGFSTKNITIKNITDSFSSLSFNIPFIQINYILKGFSVVLQFLPIIIAFTVTEFVTALQGVEQAKVAGDVYDGKKTIIGVSIMSVISALFGNPFCFSVWWGHGTWKDIKASTCYSLIVGISYFILCSTGLVAIVTAVIPTAAVLPILIFVGMTSLAGAFQNEDKKYFSLMSIAIAVPIIEYIGNIAGDAMPNSLFILAKGAPLIALAWTSILVFCSESKFKNAIITCFISAGATFIGLIHSPSLKINANLEITIAYLITAFILFIFNFKKEKI